jgi:hypothetical protein
MARHTIDTIAMLKEKTQGNLSNEETAADRQRADRPETGLCALGQIGLVQGGAKKLA